MIGHILADVLWGFGGQPPFLRLSLGPDGLQ